MSGTLWLALLALLCTGTVAPTKPYDLPVLPASLVERVSSNWPRPLSININGTTTQKYIPQDVWIACRNRSDQKPLHHKIFKTKNINWTFHYEDNQAKDEFMEKNFANTSILWVYKVLNPAIGCSRPEIWRLCVLYMNGGMYIDDDANIGAPLDEMVLPTDKLILGREVYDYDDRCFEDEFPLSNYSMNIRHGVKRNAAKLFENKFFYNWAMLSAPGHPWLKLIMEYIVTLIRHEYLYDSLIKMKPSDHRGKLLMCATTFPITHVARDQVLSDPNGASLVRDGDFRALYNADMKAWFNDHVVPNHWVKTIQKHRAPYLAEYTKSYFEAMLVQSKGRQIHLVVDSKKYGFQDWDTVVALGFDTKHIRHVSHIFIDQCSLADKLLTANDTTFSRSSLRKKMITPRTP